MAVDRAADITNQRMLDLAERLKLIYSEAAETALAREKSAIEKLAAFDKQVEKLIEQGVDSDTIRRRQLSYRRAVERETGIVRNISAEIANTSETARRIIDGVRLNVYDINYRGALSGVDNQLGFGVDWTIYYRNQLRVILSGEWQPFEKVEAREIFVRSQMDISRGYVRERAFGRLGDDRIIVTRLQNELAKSVILGESAQQIATRIKKVGEMSRRQAVTIARTEIMRVANQGRMLGFTQAYNDYGIEMQKQWIATLDNKTRDSHAHMHLERAELDEKFTNGLMQPGGDGPPEEVINCRCIVVSVLKELRGSEAYRRLVERIKRG